MCLTIPCMGKSLCLYQYLCINNCDGTCDVGSIPPPGGVSWVGAYDMSGNVWEWMENDWDVCKVVRGGAWSSGGNDLRAAYRSRYNPSNTYYSLGFRCSRSY